MATSLQTAVGGFRFVETLFGDSLQLLAARELSDASRWPEIAALNSLTYPYITDEAALASATVVRSGSLIKVPSPTSVVTDTDPAALFGADVMLDAGNLTTLDGDLAIVSGLPNLRQALVGRVQTERGDLMFHAEYGSLVRRLIGTANGPTATLLASEYARAAVQGDDRIDSVTESIATASGDSISVSVVAQPIVGRSVSVDFTV